MSGSNAIATTEPLDEREVELVIGLKDQRVAKPIAPL
jgi:hypothetical protein